MPLTPFSLKLVSTSFILVVAGMALGCLPLIYSGFAPLIFLVLALTLPAIESAELEPVEEQLEASRGDVVELTRTITFRGGVGYILLYEELPGVLELVEGNNFQLHVKGFGAHRINFSYKVLCTRRGIYEFKGVSYSLRHALDVTSPRQNTLSLNQRIVVRPPQTGVRRIRDRDRWIALLQPSDSKMQVGLMSNDFKDLTTYQSGDPYKHINWKATARVSQSIGDLPIVNEFEREGNRVVWMFLDASHSMDLGNRDANVYEHAVHVALGLADYHVSMRCMVGFSLYNDDAEGQPRGSEAPAPNLAEEQNDALFPSDHLQQRVESDKRSPKTYSLPPEAGRHQLLKINELLQSAEAGLVSADLKHTLRLNRAHLEGANPMIFLITSVRGSRVDLLREELHELQGITNGGNKGRKNIILINVQGFNLAAKTDAERIAAQILMYQVEAKLRAVASQKIAVINWDPSVSDFTSRLVKEVM